jgi:hypothetical protein
MEGERNREGGALTAARRKLFQGAVRGGVAAMAMTGLREFTRHVGLLEEPPPEKIVRQWWLRRIRGVQAGPRRAQVELVHWGYGAAAGACFAAVPSLFRRGSWSGPLFGMLVWTGFELGIAPLLTLSRPKHRAALDRLALAADHLLYGYLLSENETLRATTTE